MISEEAKHVLSAIAAGKLLRVARDGSGARLIDPPARARAQSFGQIPVSSRIVFQLQHSGVLTKLKPERQGSRAGLVELGVKDWDAAEYWCCTQ